MVGTWWKYPSELAGELDGCDCFGVADPGGRQISKPGVPPVPGVARLGDVTMGLVTRGLVTRWLDMKSSRLPNGPDDGPLMGLGTREAS